MKRSVFAILLAALAAAVACDQGPAGPRVSTEPLSVRGWVLDVEGGPNAPFRTAETEGARKQHLFQATYVEVVNAPYVSGGIAENGSFLLLDVPPGKVTIVFSGPGAPAARLDMENVPGNADVYLPALLLKPSSVELTDPASVKVRVAAHIDTAQPAGLTAKIAGRPFAVVSTPLAQMSDRHDYPVPPAMRVPVATVK